MTEVYTDLDIDFERQKYQKVNAKAGDEHTRFLRLTCYNSGVLSPLDATEQDAYLRYKKSDGTNVFSKGTIDNEGKVNVEITKQMLASYGICYADLLVVDKDSAVVPEDGKINILSTNIISSMLFVVNVQSNAFSDDDLESWDDYSELTALLELAYTNATIISGYIDVARECATTATTGAEAASDSAGEAGYYSRQSEQNMLESEAWARGTRKGVPVPSTDETYENNSKWYSEVADNESQEAETWAVGTKNGTADPAHTTNNSKYYSEQSSNSALDSEAWSNGQYHGVDIDDPTDSHYHNNSKWHSEVSHGHASDSEAYAKGTRDGVPIADTDPAYHNNTSYFYDMTKYYEDHAEAWAAGTIDGSPVPSTDPAFENNSKYWAQKAKMSVEPFFQITDIEYVLESTNWHNGEYSFETSTPPFDDGLPYRDYSIGVSLAEGATSVQRKAYGNAMLTSKFNQNVLVAKGHVPTINIPVVVSVIAKVLN